jgi:hypothetical protein
LGIFLGLRLDLGFGGDLSVVKIIQNMMRKGIMFIEHRRDEQQNLLEFVGYGR